MRISTPADSNTTTIAHRHAPGSARRDNSWNLPRDSQNASQNSVYAKPFDQWSPQGGGAENDIFRRFKILASEEEDFLTHWARQRLSSGIFSRDENGILVFRVNPAELANLSELSIVRSDMKPESESQWAHVYDKEGVSWLTRFRYVEHEAVSSRAYGSNRQAASGFEGN